MRANANVDQKGHTMPKHAGQLSDGELEELLEFVMTSRRARIALDMPDDIDSRLDSLALALAELRQRRREEANQEQKKRTS